MNACALTFRDLRIVESMRTLDGGNAVPLGSTISEYEPVTRFFVTHAVRRLRRLNQ